MDEKPLSDLSDVESKVKAAREAEEHLVHEMPNAIEPDDEDYPGMASTSADTDTVVENVEETPAPDREEETATEPVQHAVFEDEGR